MGNKQNISFGDGVTSLFSPGASHFTKQAWPTLSALEQANLARAHAHTQFDTTQASVKSFLAFDM